MEDAKYQADAYVCSVTEWEQGWGKRPDGYVLCLDTKKGEELCTKENGCLYDFHNGMEFSKRDSEWKPCKISSKAVANILNSDAKAIWIGNSREDDFQLES